MHLNEKEIYDKAISKWGETSQLLMLIEELNELSVEACHHIRGRRSIGNMYIIEEIADVEIVLAQLKMILSKENEEFEEDLNTIKTKKLRRLEERVNE